MNCRDSGLKRPGMIRIRMLRDRFALQSLSGTLVIWSNNHWQSRYRIHNTRCTPDITRYTPDIHPIHTRYGTLQPVYVNSQRNGFGKTRGRNKSELEREGGEGGGHESYL